MAKEAKQDGSLTDTLKEKAQDRPADTAAGGSAGVMDTLKGGVETVRGAFSAVTGGVGKAWSTVVEWKDEGTPLRKAIRTARLTLDDAAGKARERTTDRQKEMSECMQKMAKDRQARIEEMDKSGVLTTCAEIKKQHPELVVGGFTLAVALPSALAGKRAFFRNSAGALVLSSAVVYGGAWMKRRGLTPPQIVGEGDDSGAPPRP